MNPYIVDPILKYVAFDTLVLARFYPSLCLFLILFFETRASYGGYLPVPILGLDVVGKGLWFLGSSVVAVAMAMVVCSVYRQKMINGKTEGRDIRA